mgnify:FL=1
MASDVYTHRWRTTIWSRVSVALAAGLALALALTLLLPAPTAEASKGCSVKNRATGRTYSTLQAAVDTAKPRATLRMMGVCRGETVIERTMKIIGVPTRARGLPRFTGVRRELVLDVREGARVELANLIVERGRAFRGAGIRKAALPTSPSIVCA